jgi:hypothetical protein
MTTKQETKFDIVHDFFWHRIDNQEYVRFITDNFAGLVLASSYSLKLAEPTSDGIELANTTFSNLLSFQYGERAFDEGYDSYGDFIGDIEV